MSYYIYRITCLVNKKKYIGLTGVSVEHRWKQHLESINSSNFALHNAIRKYGANNFIVETLKEKLTKEEACFWEQQFIIGEDTISPKGYNLTRGGEGVGGCIETNKKISLSRIEFFKNEENRNIQRDIALNQWQDPIFVSNIKKGIDQRWKNAQNRENHLKSVRSPEYRELKRKQTQAYLTNPENREFQKKQTQAHWIKKRTKKLQVNEEL